MPEMMHERARHERRKERLRRVAIGALERGAALIAPVRASLDRMLGPPIRRAPAGEPPRESVPVVDPLDRVMLTFGDGDDADARDLCSNTLVLGASGSGKTSTTVKIIEDACFHAMWGGLECLAKAEDLPRIEGSLRRHGRLGDLVLLGPEYDVRLDAFALARRLARGRDGEVRVIKLVGFVENLARLIDADRGGKRGGSGDSEFFDRMARTVIRDVLTLMESCERGYSLRDARQLLRALPTQEDLAEDARLAALTEAGDAAAEARLAARCAGSIFYRVLDEAHANAERFPGARRRDLDEAIAGLFEHARREQRVRSNIEATVASWLDLLLAGEWARVFGGPSDFDLEDVVRGMVLVVASPPIRDKLMGKLINATAVFLFDWMAQSRDLESDGGMPIFKILDEAHYFLGKDAALTLTSSRSARMATVICTQSFENLVAAAGREEATSIAGNCQNKFLHACNDHEGARYAAETIGYAFRYVGNYSVNHNASGDAGGGAGAALQRHYLIEPAEMFTLRSGSARNDCVVDCIHTRGRPFVDGGHARRVAWRQGPHPERTAR